MFQVKHASVRRNDAIILDDVTLSIKRGEHVAVIGPNGAGKSTLLKILTKEVHPLAKDEFSYAFMGDERIPLLALREKLGIVSPSLLEACNTTYPAFEVVLSGLYSSYGLDFHHIVSEEDKAKAIREMEKTGTLHLKDKYMNGLSSGEAEKVILARAAVHDPDALILDEVSSALDFPMRASLRNMIGRYAREGKTIVMVTHELSEIPSECERVIVMKKGKIVADGPKAEILTEDLLSAVYEQKVYVEEKNNIFSAWC